MISPEQIAKVLSEIQASVPSELKRLAFKEEPAYPTVEFVMNEALKDENITEEKKRKIQTLIDAGTFNKKRIVENPKVQKMIDNYVMRKINKAVKAGRLPSKAEIANLPHIKDIYKMINKKHEEI